MTTPTNINAIVQGLAASIKTNGHIPLNMVEGMDRATQAKVMGAFWTSQKPAIVHEGASITLPAIPMRMEINHAIDALQRHQKASEEIVQVTEIFNEYYPFEAATAFVKAMEELHGWADPVARKTMFGPQPPQVRPVRIGPNPGDVIEVPIGNFNVPGVENPITTGITRDGDFFVTAQIKAAEKSNITKIIETARLIIKTNSIYRNKAIRLPVDDGGDLPPAFEPEFIDLSGVHPEELVHNTLTQDQIDTNILAPIVYTAQFRDEKIPLKRSILLHGTFGTGKTLTALVTAQLCLKHGWTFIMLAKAQGLAAALRFARRYQPALIFVEDIDRVVGARDEEGNDILNEIDGLESKSEVMVIMTSNEPDKITPAMRRPGRLDAVVPVLPPDGPAAEKLIRLYARNSLAPNVGMDKLRDFVSGWSPAMLREVVEVAKASRIWHQRDLLVEEDLLTAARLKESHAVWAYGEKEKPKTPTEIVTAAIQELLGVPEKVDALVKAVEDVQERL